jgi:hypothetical protein
VRDRKYTGDYPWLIKRFIDPQVEFSFSGACLQRTGIQKNFGVKSNSVGLSEYSHARDNCIFDFLIESMASVIRHYCSLQKLFVVETKTGLIEQSSQPVYGKFQQVFLIITEMMRKCCKSG